MSNSLWIQVPQSMGFSRQEYWSGLPFPYPGDLPDPGIERSSPSLWAEALPSEAPGKFTEQPGYELMRSYFIWWNSASFPLLHVLSPKMVLWVFIVHCVLVFYPPRSCNTFFLKWNVALSALSFPESPHKICSFPYWPQVSLHVSSLPSLPTIPCNSSEASCLFVLLTMPGSLFAPGYLVCLHHNNVSLGPCLWSPLCFVFPHLD